MSDSEEELEEIVIQEPGVGASLANSVYEENLVHYVRRFMKCLIIFVVCVVLFASLCGGGWSIYVGLCHIIPGGENHPFLNCSSGEHPK